ncbi:hypothetical protein GCM10027589_09860 [Actinocorallia lasiicapitis]
MSTLDLSRAQWRKSTHSSGNGECVELAEAGRRDIAVRDSKHPAIAPLLISRASLRKLISASATHP